MKVNSFSRYLAVGLILLFSSVQAELLDRGNGMIYDTVLDITWLQDANYAFTSGYDDDGNMTWYEAVEWADQLVYGGFDDWRLASLSVSAGTPVGEVDYLTSLVNCHFEPEEACHDNEYGYMFVYNLGGANGDNLTGNQTSLSGVDLYNIQYAHWSGNTFADFEAYVFFFGGGNPYYDGKTSHWAAWAVRNGDIDDPSCAYPDPPAEFDARLKRDTVYMSWQITENTKSYDVYRSLDFEDFKVIANTGLNSYQDKPPANIRVVEYYVVAVNECGKSFPSEVSRIWFERRGGRNRPDESDLD